MKKLVVLIMVLVLACGAAFASGGKNRGTTGNGSTNTGSTSQGAGA